MTPYLSSLVLDILRLNSRLHDASRTLDHDEIMRTLAALRHTITLAEVHLKRRIVLDVEVVEDDDEL